MEGLFQTWLTQIHSFSLESEMKRSLMGLTAILTVDPKDQNKLIIQNMKPILDAVFSLASTLDSKKEKKLVKDAKDADEEYEEDEDAREELLNDYLKRAQPSVLGNGGPVADEDLLEEDEDDDDEEWDEFGELNNMTILDKIDEILMIRDTFGLIMQSNPAYYQDLMKLMDDPTKLKLETNIKNAEARLTLKGNK